MKKVLVFLLAIVFVVSNSGVLTIFANDTIKEDAKVTNLELLNNEINTKVVEGDFEYIQEGESITITKYLGTSAEVAMPDTINGKQVTKIGDSAFDSNANIQTVSLPASIVEIGRYGFASCGELLSIEINSPITEIKDGTFQGCAKLVDIVLPNTVKKIGEQAFGACLSLKKITLPSNLETIGHAAFNYCALTKIELPASLISVEGAAFSGCQFTSFDLPSSILIPTISESERFEFVFGYQQIGPISAVKQGTNWYINLKDIDETLDVKRIKKVAVLTGSGPDEKINDLSTIDGTYDENAGIVCFTSNPVGKEIIYTYQVQSTEAGKTNLLEADINIGAVKNGYVVHFDKDGIDDKLVIVGETYKNLPDISKKGYNATWNTQADGKGVTITNDSIVEINSDHTLYPIYTANTYEVSFDAGDGQFVNKGIITKQVIFDSVYGQLPTATKVGFDFMGWNTQLDGKGQFITKDSIVNKDSNHSLYAIYKKTDSMQQPDTPDRPGPDQSTNPETPNISDSIEKNQLFDKNDDIVVTVDHTSVSARLISMLIAGVMVCIISRKKYN